MIAAVTMGTRGMDTTALVLLSVIASVHLIPKMCIADIDECTTGESSCNQVCHNTKGSYYCSCNTGYYLESNTYTCSGKILWSLVHCSLKAITSSVDINECADSNGGCHHSCVNTDGSYNCQCSDGYQLNADAHTCEGTSNPLSLYSTYLY